MKTIKSRRRGAETSDAFNSTFLTEANSTSMTFVSYLDRNKKLAPVSRQLSKERRLILSVMEEKRILEAKITRTKLEEDKSLNFQRESTKWYRTRLWLNDQKKKIEASN